MASCMTHAQGDVHPKLDYLSSRGHLVTRDGRMTFAQPSSRAKLPLILGQPRSTSAFLDVISMHRGQLSYTIVLYWRRQLRRNRMLREHLHPVDTYDDVQLFERFKFRRADLFRIIDELSSW